MRKNALAAEACCLGARIVGARTLLKNGLLSGDFATFMRATPFGRVQKGMMFISTCARCHTSLPLPASTDTGEKAAHDCQSAACCRTVCLLFSSLVHPYNSSCRDHVCSILFSCDQGQKCLISELLA